MIASVDIPAEGIKKTVENFVQNGLSVWYIEKDLF